MGRPSTHYHFSKKFDNGEKLAEKYSQLPQDKPVEIACKSCNHQMGNFVILKWLAVVAVSKLKRKFIWEKFLPQRNLTPVPGTKELRRYHLHESQVQIVLKRAVRRAKLTKRVTSHIFRQSFATHLLQVNEDL